ncbi:MAG: T9SS type A sorting domain-containing protein [Paludibacter sp.]|nr:T9SS type A sorting domain-containing protein [Paludibacter sp.]
MKKQLLFLRSFLMFFVLLNAFSARAAVIPYLPALQNLNGSSANLSTFTPIEGDYTLEVQGTVGTQISIAGGAYTYTPTTNGTVRFSQKKGLVYVYEANVYKTTLTPAVTITYPAITDADAATNVNNLLQNSSFETPGTLVGGTNYNFGTPWVTNVIVAASAGIRVSSATAGNFNGIYECVWRGSANTNYFAQPISSAIEANASYKVIVRQLTCSNASATFNVGLGTTTSGMEYDYNSLVLGGSVAAAGTFSTIIKTPATVSGTAYFTFKNTTYNTSSAGTDPLTQIDYIALVKGTVTVTAPGITGASSATFLAGTAYAPENLAINFTTGDTYDMTGLLANPTIEGPGNSTIPKGWTVDKGTGNTFTATGQHYSLVSTNRYLDSYNGTAGSMLYTAQQTITGIPNGTYRLSFAARTSGAGSYLVAKSAGKAYRTEIINNAAAGGTLGNGFSTITVDAAVLDNTLTLGVSTSAAFTGGSAWSGTWFSADDFTLGFLGEQKVLTVSQSSFLFDDKNTSKTFNVSGAFLTEGVTLSAPEGITLSKTSMTASEAQDGVQITAQFTGTASMKNALISIAAGSLSKSISVNALSGDAACFNSPLYTDRANLIADPYCNDRTKFGGWGNVAISEVKSFCGERSIKAFGGSLDASVAGGTAIASNKTYRAKAKIFVPAGHTAKFGLFLIGNTADVDVYNSSTNDAWETADFTFKTATIGAGGVFFQRTTGTDSVYIDNYEMYEVTEPTVRVKYVDVDDVNTSVKTDRVYTATWGTSLANYLTIGKSYAALTTDKDVVSFGGYNYNYDNTSIENVTIAEGENVIVLKFKKDVSTGSANLGNSEIAVYPTITDGTVNVSLVGKTGSIRVFDVAGRIVTAKVASSSREVVLLPSTGVYFVEVNSNNVTKIFKVISVK